MFSPLKTNISIKDGDSDTVVIEKDEQGTAHVTITTQDGIWPLAQVSALLQNVAFDLEKEVGKLEERHGLKHILAD
ncbi:MAG: hypothetical protein KMY50_00475 [Candidatus Desulforudis sp.]|nr:hypothetical protein [Desulforudis sp.]